MLINKVTTGFVVQVFDTEQKQFVSQEFVAGDDCQYEDKDGVPVCSEALEVEGNEVYLPFEMKQPRQPVEAGNDMAQARSKVVVPVTFTGTVEVEVPTGVPPERREVLARKVALARVLATTENPDAPEDDACAEYEEEFGLDEATAGHEWDDCVATGASGAWSLQATTDDRSAVAERLADKAESAGLQPEDLDEIVHELASSVAADINNGGLEEQLMYPVEGLGAQHAERQIDELIQERKKEEESPPTEEDEE